MFNRIETALEQRYGKNLDPWGLETQRVLFDLKLLWPFYHYYFDVKIHGKEKVMDTAYMVVSNHTGQIPIDGLLICTAFATEFNTPIFLRPLVERFLTAIPFIGKWSTEGGAVLGDRANCINLLKRGDSVLIFPEGVRGIAKNSNEFYQQKRFTRGFLRMALTSNAQILPIAVVGAEEFYPFVFHLRKLASFLKIPAFPIATNLFPLPSPVDIYIGDPYQLPTDLSPDALDEELEPHLLQIEKKIKELTEFGLKNKRSILQRFQK